MNPEAFIVFAVGDDARTREVLSKLLPPPRLAHRSLRLSGGAYCLPTTQPQSLSKPGYRVTGSERHRFPETDFPGRPATRRGPYRERQHSLVGACNRAQRGGLPDKAVYEGRFSRRHPTRSRAGSSITAAASRQSYASRTRGAAVGGQRVAQQAGGCMTLTRHQRVTPQIHRCKIMEAEGRLAADLVRFAATLHIPVTYSRRAGNVS